MLIHLRGVSDAVLEREMISRPAGCYVMATSPDISKKKKVSTVFILITVGSVETTRCSPCSHSYIQVYIRIRKHGKFTCEYVRPPTPTSVQQFPFTPTHRIWKLIYGTKMDVTTHTRQSSSYLPWLKCQKRGVGEHHHSYSNTYTVKRSRWTISNIFLQIDKAKWRPCPSSG